MCVEDAVASSSSSGILILLYSCMIGKSAKCKRGVCRESEADGAGLNFFDEITKLVYWKSGRIYRFGKNRMEHYYTFSVR